MCDSFIVMNKQKFTDKRLRKTLSQLGINGIEDENGSNILSGPPMRSNEGIINVYSDPVQSGDRVQVIYWDADTHQESVEITEAIIIDISEKKNNVILEIPETDKDKKSSTSAKLHGVFGQRLFKKLL